MTKKTSAVNAAVQKVTEITGEAKVNVLDNRWLKRMGEGVIVDIRIRRWRARTRLVFEDLGVPIKVEAREAVEDLLTLGEKFLLPVKIVRKMDSADSAARKYLARETFPTVYGAFVPFTEYAEVKAELEKRRAEYLAAGNQIADSLDEITAAHLRNCEAAARQAYARLCRLTPKYKGSAGYMDEEEFVRNFKEQIRKLIPKKEDVRASYGFDIRISYIPLPSLIARDMAAAKQIEAKADVAEELIREKAQAKREVFVAERDRHLEEEELERLKVEAEIDIERKAISIRDAQLEGMKKDVEEQAKRDAEAMIAQFQNDLQRQLYAMVNEAVTDIMATNKEKAFLHPRSCTQLRNLLDKAAKMNFFGNEEINSMLKTAQGILEAKEQPMDLIQDSLRDIAICTRAVLLDLGEEPRMGREADSLLDIRTVPGDSVVRQSRLSLGLPEIATEDFGVRGARTL